jgi:hypothetical protein
MGHCLRGGIFQSPSSFPKDFQQHAPNHHIYSDVASFIYPDGVCISILHPPGEDEFNTQEIAEERWRQFWGGADSSVGNFHAVRSE